MPRPLTTSRTPQAGISAGRAAAAPDDEIVEDSEPEREERRWLEKHRRRERRELEESKKTSKVIEVIDVDSPSVAVPITRDKTAFIESHSVIVISDDSDDVLTASSKGNRVVNKSANSLRFITSSSSDLSDSTLPSIRDILGLPPRQAPQTSTSQGSAYPPPPTQTTIGGSVQTSEVPTCPETGSGTEEERPRPFSLARFAYVRPSRTPSGSSSSFRSFSTPSVVNSRETSKCPSIATDLAQATPNPLPEYANRVDAKPPAKRGRKARSPSQSALSSIPESDLTHLLRCVACNLAWTTRKTVVQKMKHIQSCARKAGLTDETLEILVRQELEKMPAKSAVTGKNKDEAEKREPKTLLGEKINDEEAAGKRRRYQHVETTVRELTETRGKILERARLLLKSPTLPRNKPDAISPFRNESAEDDGPPLTQPFAESALARQFQPTRVIISQGPSQVYVPSPPRQRAIQDERGLLAQSPDESALTEAFGLNSRLFTDQAEESSFHTPDLDFHCSRREVECNGTDPGANRKHRSSTLRKENIVPISIVTPAANVSLNAHSPHSPSSNSFQSGNLSIIQQETRTSQDQTAPPSMDDFCGPEYDYDAGDQAILHYEPNHQNDVLDAIRTTTLSEDPNYDDALSSQVSSSKGKAKPTATRAKPKSKSKKKAVTLTEEEVYARLKESILKDAQLYLRILRYEPLPLDMFIQLVAGESEEGVKVTGALKLQVRACLDKEAIQFYDHEVGGPRTKKRRK